MLDLDLKYSSSDLKTVIQKQLLHVHGTNLRKPMTHSCGRCQIGNLNLLLIAFGSTTNLPENVRIYERHRESQMYVLGTRLIMLIIVVYSSRFRSTLIQVVRRVYGTYGDLSVVSLGQKDYKTRWTNRMDKNPKTASKSRKEQHPGFQRGPPP
jgi:hypothetical protein